MVTKRLKTEKMTIKCEVLSHEKHVFWTSEVFDSDETKPMYLVIDSYPANGNAANAISLTQNLVHNQVANQLGGRGFWLAHLYSKMPVRLTNAGLEHVDEEYEETNLNELLKVAKSATHIIVATGSITRKFQAASDRLGMVLDALANTVPDTKVDFLVAGDTELPAAVVSRLVRVGGGDWILKPKDDVTWWRNQNTSIE